MQVWQAALELASPYQTKSAIDARQSSQLTGFGDSFASWVVEGDDGIAYIELAPTMVSGALRATFEFRDGDTVREQEIEAWLIPGECALDIVGIAEGSIGARSIADNMERGGNFDSDLGENARVALYAKGRVLGKFLLTLAYDSAKQKEEQRLFGTIDPAAYYTVFGDNAVRAFRRGKPRQDLRARREQHILRSVWRFRNRLRPDLPRSLPAHRYRRESRSAHRSIAGGRVRGECRAHDCAVKKFRATDCPAPTSSARAASCRIAKPLF